MTPEELFSKTFEGKDYNCVHAAADAFEVFGRTEQKEILLAAMNGGPDGTLLDRKHFKRCDKPEHAALVLMRRKGAQAHFGVYLRGKILQLTEDGMQYMTESAATFGYSSITYYRIL